MAYVLTLQPTFTQGFIIGQLSIIILLALILKYLFLDSSNEPLTPGLLVPSKTLQESTTTLDQSNLETSPVPLLEGLESTEWFNLIIREIFSSYRAEIRDNAKGLAGDEVARARVERWLNEHKGTGLIDPIIVEAVSLGNSAPRLFNAQIIPNDLPKDVSGGRQIQIEVTYVDSISVRLTTSLFFNQPVPAFARLPVSLSLALKSLKATIVIVPPIHNDPNPTLTLKLLPDLSLSLQSTSLLGSRAKLANVPKVHELIENRIKNALIERGTWKIHLPMKRDSL
ncbi:hypothetical protein M408DRAFT_325634 [Serendipita vermifera MAFF 305830]|uniref:SMP-LTD domain-containing protein n=1 Tax=Serendipita vermifera MAFF 305830 TaxID=933852 RepID=A0A0C3BRY5_SERVB|nr:hypothetical protein M408DRAFT_325634 [Serendipita vermifera MAFF 305830]